MIGVAFLNEIVFMLIGLFAGFKLGRIFSKIKDKVSKLW